MEPEKCYFSCLESIATENVDAINLCLIAEGNRREFPSHQTPLRNADLVTILHSH